MFRAIIFNEYLCCLVESGIEQSGNDIIIDKDLYDQMLKANQEKFAEIRVIELEDGKLSVKDFYDRKPSDLHFWNRKTQQFDILDEDKNTLKEADNIAFLSSETRRVNDAISPLDDAIEFEIATEDEIYRHKELRKYRLLLSRVPTQEGWPLKATFPEAPEFFK